MFLKTKQLKTGNIYDHDNPPEKAKRKGMLMTRAVARVPHYERDQRNEK